MVSSAIMGRSLDYLSSIASVDLGKGIVETLCQLAQELVFVHAMLLCYLASITGIMSPHHIDQELELLGVQGRHGDDRGARVGHR